MTRRALASALVLTLLAGVVIASSSTPSYTLTDLGPGYPVAVSPAGSVVGWNYDANSHQRSFLWTAATGQTDLGIADSSPVGVNADGVVAGSMSTSAGVQRAFRWKAGVTTDLGTLPGFAFSQAGGVNASGQIVGTCGNDTWSVTRAFIWQDGAMTDLGTLPGFTSSAAYAVNASGQVIGVCTYADDAGYFTRAFLWQNGTMTDLGTLGGSYSSPTAISDSGVVVGASYFADDETTECAFEWDASNGMRSLLPVEGNGSSVATGVNDAGQVAGWCYSVYWTWDDDYGWLMSYGPGTATFWQDGAPSALAGPNSYAHNVNNATAAHGAQVAGEALGACGEFVPMLWEIDAGGQATSRALDESLNAAFTGHMDYPVAINDAEQIAVSGESSGFEQRAFLLSPSSQPSVQQAIHAPAYVAATAGTARVTISWSTVCGADSYVVKRGTTVCGPYQTIASGLTSVQYEDTSAPLGTTYHYVVLAVKGTTPGTPSAEAVAAPLPYAPTGLAAKALTGKQKNQISLTWTKSASGNIARYKVYRNTSTGPVLVATLGTATSYTATGLSSRTRYSFYVTAVHAGGQESFASVAASATTK